MKCESSLNYEKAKKFNWPAKHGEKNFIQSFKAYIEIQNAEAVQCYQIFFFIFMCKYKIILQNLQVFSWELSNSRKDETAAKCILIIQLHNNQ